MANIDIDNLLREIKRKKQASVTGKTEDGKELGTKPAVENNKEKERGELPENRNTADRERSEMSRESKETLARFINNTSSPEDRSGENKYDDIENSGRKSDDYLDDRFKKFFNDSVIVTKPPRETGKPEIKRKKWSLLNKGYVTDSLSLNMEKLAEEEEKLTRRQRRLQEKEKAAAERPRMPIVKTAGDVWAEKNTDDISDVQTGQTEEQPAEKPAKEKRRKNKTYGTKKSADRSEKGISYIFGGDEDEDESRSTGENDILAVAQPQEESGVTERKQKNLSRAEKNTGSQSLNSLLGDDRDPESLAQKILQQRKSRQSARVVAVMDKPENGGSQPKNDTAADSVQTQDKKTKVSIPDETDGIINTIYTSVIEKQASEALATEQITGYIPEFEEDDQEEKTVTVTARQEEDVKEEVFEEYISKSEFLDKKDEESRDIQSELLSFRGTLSLRIFLGLVTGLILTYFNMAAQNSLPMPDFIHPAAQPLMYALACMVVYTIAFAGFLPTVISGFKSLKDSPAPDSFVSLGAVLALVQIGVMAVASTSTDMTKTTVFGAFICIALSFNAMGKKIATNTILKNLTLANAPSGINAGYIVNDSDAVKRLARTLDEKLPKVLVSRKAGKITNFVNAGFSIHNSDYTASKVSVAGYAVTAVCFVMGVFLSKSLATGVYCAAGSAALMIPLSHTLVNSVPSALMQKTLEKVGALVNGWQGIDQLSKTTHVNFDARHLFPRGTVILHGIKTFEKERIDLAILYAASVLIKECEVLKPVFMEVIDGKTDILPKVDGCEYIEQQGYVSWINDSRVLIGNRTLMEQYDVAMPPLSMESRFINRGRKTVYIAVSGKLFGMFVFSYRPDEIVKENLERLKEKGVCVILSSKDFNIDPQLIESVYGIPSDYISVLNRREANLMAQFTGYAPESECRVAHLDSLSSLVAGFCGAESARSAESVCSIIQTISVVIGAVLALLFTYSQTIMNLPLLSVMLLSFGFMGIAMLTAVAKKYE